MDVQDQIIAFLRTTGPTIPTKVAKTIKSDILIASAHLSDLSARKKVLISSLKVGGSPLYYLPGQEGQLYQFARENLNPKDYEVLERLRNEKVLRENNLDLLAKVALRQLKDFAVPLQVRFDGGVEFFWRWYLLPSEEASKVIAHVIDGEKEETFAEKEELAQAVSKKELASVVKVEADEQKVEHRERDEKLPDLEKRVEKTDKKSRRSSQREVQRKLVKGNETVTDPFLPILQSYFEEFKIQIEEATVVRKNSEMDLIVRVSTVVGSITYFCKAKRKARCDEKDLSSAYMEAQIKKLPLLFLYTQTLTKKAQEMLDTNVFQNVVVKKLE